MIANQTTLLTEERVLSITGPDAKKFLQGQTTADFLALPDLGIIKGAFCDPKGRIIADFLACAVDSETLWLRVQKDVAEQLAAHLKKYIAFSKATLSVTDVGVYGQMLVDQATGESSNDEGATGESVKTVRETEGGLVIPRGANAAELWLEAGATRENNLPQSAWYAAAIHRMEPRISASTMGKYLPQDLNLDLTGGVNFKKGCYTGQEVIARLHYRGKPKRRLYRAESDCQIAPDAGAALYLAGETQSCGSVVNATVHNGLCELLVETTDTGANAPLLTEQDGLEIRVQGSLAN